MTFPPALRGPRRLCVAVAVSALAVMSCSTRREGEEWIRKRQPEAFYVKWDVLPPDRAREVSEDVRDEAVALLESESGRALSQEEVHRFVPNASALGGRWYLLRAVRAPNDDGSFQVLTRGRAVAVVYTKSSRTNETIKTAVAAYLEMSPEAPYVEITSR